MGKYDDIINYPHHQSNTRAHMPLQDRAAQFAPFAALTGFEASVNEAARQTVPRVDLTESKKEELNAAVQIVWANITSQPLVELTYFIEDTQKDGGKYVTRIAHVNKINKYERNIILTDGTVIPMDDISEMEMLTYDGI